MLKHPENKDVEASFRGTLVREMISHFTSYHLLGKLYRKGEILKRMVEPAWVVPEGYEHRVVTMENFTMEWLWPQNGTKDYTILQLHGGGYIGAMRNIYRNFAVEYSRLGGNLGVLTIDYRVAPEHPYPCALEDAVAAYEWLLQQGYEGRQIILAGDSAGGGLSMALTMYLRDHNYPMPAGVIAMSPWTDLTSQGESYQTNYEKDPLFGKTRDSLIYNRDYVGMEDAACPYISPLYGEFYHFPPMLLQVGSYEMLLSDSTEVAKKARQQGVKVRLTIYEGMFHVFQMALGHLPESVRAWKEIENYLKWILDANEEG